MSREPETDGPEYPPFTGGRFVSGPALAAIFAQREIRPTYRGVTKNIIPIGKSIAAMAGAK